MYLILKHLKKTEGNIKEGVCSLCGRKEKNVWEKHKILSSNFNDWQIFKFKSDFLCSDCYAGFSGNSFNGKSIRNFNILATDKEIKILDRKDIIEVIRNLPEEPFELQVTFSYKKHCFFYCDTNYNKDFIVIGTDLGKVKFNVKEFLQFYEIVKELYEGGFNKNEIMTGISFKYEKIEKFGDNRYYELNNKIEKIRNTLYMLFMLSILIKNKEGGTK